jgi:hypothetical protein
VKRIKRKSKWIITSLRERKYKSLLIMLVAMILIPSFITHLDAQKLVSFLLTSSTIFLAISAIIRTKTQLYTGFACAGVVIFVNQIGIFKSEASLDFYLSFVIYLLFYIYVAYRLLRMIIGTTNVGIGVLYASVIVYLLIGVVGGYLFMLIENASPGSITNLEVTTLKNPKEFFYFSFTTLSTLGYGEITPFSAAARAISITLSTIGPLYLTVLIALLVSRFEHSDIH